MEMNEMMASNNYISCLANLEYDLFVVNTHAVAVQADNGKYYTKYFPISPLILQSMIANHGSLGCYQQVYNSSYIRWLCLDFDCGKEEPIDLNGLFQNCILPVARYLDARGIHFLLEFSGRRGIHIWIILDKLIKKNYGYRVINTIIDAVPGLQNVLEEGKYALDRFPATGSDKKNKVGKQVKFPLSWHRKGSRSFFFRIADAACWEDVAESQFLDEEAAEYFESDTFYRNQAEILQGYETETRESLCEKLGIDDEEHQTGNIYKQYSLIDRKTASLEEIVKILTGTTVYSNIFRRMERGQALTQDWLVLLGTFSSFDDCTELLTTLFSEFPNYDIEKTLKNIKRLKDHYYPATFGYLYQLYNLEIESWIDQDMTAVDYLADKLSFGVNLKKRLKRINEKEGLTRTEYIIKKELKYLQENDEVISVSLRNKLSTVKTVEAEKIEEYIEAVLSHDGEFSHKIDYTVYCRDEEGKQRRLVSLGPFDRLVTTSLVLHLYREMKYNQQSYSYKVSCLEADNLFYPWFSSWRRYIDEIRKYLELPFMSGNYVIYLDLKHCYDNIDMLVIYNNFKESLSERGRRAFEYLCDYNDRLMKEMSQGSRIGIPQGPAYARILAEIYLDEVIEDILKEYGADNYKLFRYVDDIVVFCEDNQTAKHLYKILREGFGNRGLPINTEKSRNYGIISGMTQKEKDELLHRNRFNYDLVEKASSEITFDRERRKKLMKYLRDNPFEISLVGYIFSDYTFDEAKEYCFKQFGGIIMNSREGRGKSFRQFYSYLFSGTEQILYADANNWFREIPVDSINFSNFITTLYFMIQNSQITETNIRLIILSYLDDEFDFSGLSPDDRATTEAIMMKYMVG